MRYGPGISQLVEPKRRKKKHYLISDTIVLDQERCVVCWRCIRYLQEWEDKPQLGLFERGGKTIIDIQDGQPVRRQDQRQHHRHLPGRRADQPRRPLLLPPVGDRAHRPASAPTAPMGCNIRLDTRTHKLRRIIGRENMQVNDQWICDKGRFAHAWVNAEDRLTMPLVRKDGELVPASWAEAITYVADRLSAIKQQHGADAIGGIGSAKLSNESQLPVPALLPPGHRHQQHRPPRRQPKWRRCPADCPR